ncbi:MAG: hypothetical protein AAGN82_10760 [Myxococcota bacterium]
MHHPDLSMKRRAARAATAVALALVGVSSVARGASPAEAPDPRATQTSGGNDASNSDDSSSPFALRADGSFGPGWDKYLRGRDCLPPVIDTWDGTEIPPGYERTYRLRTVMIYGGLATFALGYGVTLVGAALPVHYEANAHDFIPVAGPYAEGFSADGPKFTTPWAAIFQTLGAGVALSAFLFPEAVLTRLENADVHLDVSPLASPDQSGVNLTGAF